MFKKILVAFDGSSHAQNALQSALSLVQGKEEDSRIVVLFVQNYLADYAKFAAAGPMSIVQANIDIDEILQEKADRIRKQVEDTIPETKAQIQLQFKNGDPAKEICKFVREGSYDLIIMGSRGLGAMAELTIGSVSHKVIQHSAEPVLIVK